VRGAETKDETTTRLAEGLASVINGQVSGQERWRGSASFVELEHRLAGRRRRQRLRFALLAIGSTTIAGVAGFAVRARFSERSAEPITFTVDGRPSLPNGATVPDARATGESVLSFSDGTRIEMAPRARGRVVALNARGGRIAIEEGRAHVDVAHRAGAEWLFQAGPFVITVHGTAFSVGWSANDAHFDLRMETGVVSVTGPVSGGEIVLRAGETLSIGLRDGPSMAIDPTLPEMAVPISPAVPATSNGAPEPSRRIGRARAQESWPFELAEGRADDVVKDARRLGIASVLATRSSEELAALADAARYQRDAGLAREALLAQRKRFPGSTRATEASFLIGRLDDESTDGPARALGWYDRYLAEAPRGAYVSEALGREMLVLERAHRREEAAAIAATYLQRFPRGTYAAAAEALAHPP
jgi:FecR protein